VAGGPDRVGSEEGDELVDELLLLDALDGGDQVSDRLELDLLASATYWTVFSRVMTEACRFKST
jgi:hypothetical protein